MSGKYTPGPFANPYAPGEDDEPMKGREPSDTVVDAVAAAMHAAKPPEYTWELAGETVQRAMRKMARAAIDAYERAKKG